MSTTTDIETEEKGEATVAVEGPVGVDQDPSTPTTPANLLEPNGSNPTNGEKAATDVETAAAVPEAPLHSIFSGRQKRFICAMIAMGSIFSPVSSFIYLPALNTLSRDLRVSSASINLTVTSYQIFQGLAPMFFGDLADNMGRRPVYVICFTIYFAANLGLALQSSYAALFILRALQSTGSSGTIALGNGVMADIVTSAERGAYVGWVQAGISIGAALGPTIGGLLSKFLGWRSIFWFLVITSGTYLAAYVMLVPETGRGVVGNGSIPPQGWNMSLMNYLQNRKATKGTGDSQEKFKRAQTQLAQKRKLRFPNPLNALRIVVEKDVACVLFFGSLLVTIFYCLMVVIPKYFNRNYGFNDLQVGLCYLPFAAGSVLGNVIGGKVLDYNYRRVARKVGFSIDRKRGDDLREFPIERARLEVAGPSTILGLIALAGFGWIIEARTSLAVPLVVLFFAGLFMSGLTSTTSTLLVDLYPASPSTAMAAFNLTRCGMSAAGTATVQYIIDAMGTGWCFTFLGLLGMLATPLLLVVMKWGPKWREERFLRLQKKKEETDEKKTSGEETHGEVNAAGEKTMPVSPTDEKEKDAVRTGLGKKSSGGTDKKGVEDQVGKEDDLFDVMASIQSTNGEGRMHGQTYKKN